MLKPYISYASYVDQTFFFFSFRTQRQRSRVPLGPYWFVLSFRSRKLLLKFHQDLYSAGLVFFSSGIHLNPIELNHEIQLEDYIWDFHTIVRFDERIFISVVIISNVESLGMFFNVEITEYSYFSLFLTQDFHIYVRYSRWDGKFDNLISNS